MDNDNLEHNQQLCNQDFWVYYHIYSLKPWSKWIKDIWKSECCSRMEWYSVRNMYRFVWIYHAKRWLSFFSRCWSPMRITNSLKFNNWCISNYNLNDSRNSSFQFRQRVLAYSRCKLSSDRMRFARSRLCNISHLSLRFLHISWVLPFPNKFDHFISSSNYLNLVL